MKKLALPLAVLALISAALVGCGAGDISDKAQSDKAAALDAKAKASPDADKVEK